MRGNGKQTDEITLILALATGASNKDAAVAGGISESTIYRRFEDAEFRDQIIRARHDIMVRACGIAANAATAAMTTLTELTDEAYEPKIRLGAAKAILNEGLQLRDGIEEKDRSVAFGDKPGPLGNLW